MTSRGKGLILLGVAVLVAAVVLLVVARGGGGAGGSSTASTPAAEPPTGEAPATTGGGNVSSTPTPSLPGAPAPATGGVREYVVGDRLVRDHRSGDKPPIDIPPAIHAPDSRRIASTVTHAVGQQIKDVVKRCAADLPPEARGEAPRLEGLAVIAIKDHQVTVTKATVQLRNVVGVAADAIEQCIEQKSLQVTSPAEGEADLASYDINLSYAL